MTAAPAARMGFKDRGLVAPGKKADLVLFDPATISDRATFDQPHQFPVGIDYVLVNGEVVVSPAGHAGKRPGVVLTRGA